MSRRRFFMPLGNRVTSLGHSVTPPDYSSMCLGNFVMPLQGKVIPRHGWATPSRNFVTSKKMFVTPKNGRETRSSVPSGCP